MKKRVTFVVAIFLVVLIGFVEYLLLWVSALIYKDHSYKIATIITYRYVLCHWASLRGYCSSYWHNNNYYDVCVITFTD